MTAHEPPAEAVEAACRAVHPTRWEYRTIAHPCEECTTAVTAAAPVIATAATARAHTALDELAHERDEARQQVADLRAGIEALAAEFEKPSPSTLAYKSEVVRAVRALLAGSGEQPGEDVTCSRCQTCGRDQRAGWCKHPAPAVPDVVRELDAVMHHHADRADAAEAEADRLAALLDVAQEDLAAAEAPAVPDSADVRYLADRIETAMTDDGHRMPRTDETRYLAHVAAQTALAVVGQGVTAEQGTKSMPATTSVTVYDEGEA